MIDLRALEESRDPRTTDEILNGLAFRPDSDVITDWWNSPRNYQFYSGISKLLQPRDILEVGVRFAYSLIAMARASLRLESIIGVDGQFYVDDSQDKATKNISACGFGPITRLITGDSRKILPELPKVSFDLIHLDGGHYRESVRDDLLEAWPLLRPGGTAIVDDTSYLPECALGAEDAKAALSDLATSFYFQTFMGWWVAVKKP